MPVFFKEHNVNVISEMGGALLEMSLFRKAAQTLLKRIGYDTPIGALKESIAQLAGQETCLITTTRHGIWGASYSVELYSASGEFSTLYSCHKEAFSGRPMKEVKKIFGISGFNYSETFESGTEEDYDIGTCLFKSHMISKRLIDPMDFADAASEDIWQEGKVGNEQLVTDFRESQALIEKNFRDLPRTDLLPPDLTTWHGRLAKNLDMVYVRRYQGQHLVIA